MWWFYSRQMPFDAGRGADASTEPSRAGPRRRSSARLGRRFAGFARRAAIRSPSWPGETDLSVGYLSLLERDLSTPSINALHAISRALGVTISWFFDAGEIPAGRARFRRSPHATATARFFRRHRRRAAEPHARGTARIAREPLSAGRVVGRGAVHASRRGSGRRHPRQARTVGRRQACSCSKPATASAFRARSPTATAIRTPKRPKSSGRSRRRATDRSLSRHANVWEETAVAPPRAAARRASRGRVLVIGAGYLGLSAALHLARGRAWMSSSSMPRCRDGARRGATAAR